MKHAILIILMTLPTFVNGQDGKFIETNGVKLYYEIHGQGEALLLLHGGTMSHDMWTPWLGDLTQKYQVITIDLRGHGQSTNPTNTLAFNEVATDLFGVLDKLGIDKVRAMGFSGGGMTLIHMATRQPHRFQSLVLIGAAPYFPVETRKNMRKINYEYVSSQNPGWMKYMQSIQPGGEEQIRNVLTWYTQSADSYDNDTSMNFTPPFLSIIECPTLIIQGDREPNWPADIALDLHNAVPHSNLWIIPNLGHSVPNKGTAFGDMFITTITEFMSGEWTN